MADSTIAPFRSRGNTNHTSQRTFLVQYSNLAKACRLECNFEKRWKAKLCLCFLGPLCWSHVFRLRTESFEVGAGGGEGRGGGRGGVRVREGGHVVSENSGLERDAGSVAERDPLPHYCREGTARRHSQTLL